MMTKDLRIYLALVGLIFALPHLAAEETSAPVAQLKAGDIEHFIDTFPQMVRDLKKMGSDFGNIQDPTKIQAMLASEQVREVLARYQWDQAEYMRKLTAIAGGFATVRLDEQLAAMPEGQRAMVKQMMGGQMAQLLAVHPNDVKMVQRHRAALERFFESQ